MSRKIGRVLSIDIIQHAGARSRGGRIRHNGRRYTLFGALSGVQKAAAQIALGASGTPGAQVAQTMLLARSLGRGGCPGQIYGEISLSLAQFRFEHLVGLRQCECATDQPAGERAARADSGVAAKESKVVSHTTFPYHHTIPLQKESKKHQIPV